MNDAKPTFTPLARRLKSTAATLTSTPAEKPAASSSASCAHVVGATMSAQRLRARVQAMMGPGHPGLMNAGAVSRREGRAAATD